MQDSVAVNANPFEIVRYVLSLLKQVLITVRDQLPREGGRRPRRISLVSALSSTLFGLYVGGQLEPRIGAFLGVFVATLVWGWISLFLDETRGHVASAIDRNVRVPGLRSLVRRAAPGVAFLLLGASPLLVADVDPGRGNLSNAVTVPWIIYAIAIGSRDAHERWYLPTYRGPFSYLSDLVGFVVAVLWTIALAAGGGFLACGVAAAIAVGEGWMAYVGYFTIVCGAMTALHSWFPGRATQGFDEATGVLVATLALAAPVGWTAYLVAYY